MKKFLAMLLCVLVFASIFSEMQAYGAGDYGKEVNFKPTSSSKKYSSDSADELGITLYQSAKESVTTLEVSCTLQRLLSQVNGVDATPAKSITKLTNYKDMADAKIVRQAYHVGALKIKNKKILVSTACTRLELARQLAYYDEYFGVYEQRKAVKLVDTKSAYAKYAYQAGLLDAPARRFYPDDEVTLDDLLDVLIRLQENSSLEIETEDIQNALVKTFKVVKNEKELLTDAVKMDKYSVKKLTVKVSEFDDIWSDNTAIVEVQVMDFTNSALTLEAYGTDGVAKVYGLKNNKTELLLEVVVGTGYQTQRITISDVTVEVGQKTSLVYKYSGDEKLQWGSSDPSVATVENGIVTAVSSGICEITCYSKTYIGTAKVTVVKNNIKLSTNEIVLRNAKSYNIDVIIDGYKSSNYTSTSTDYSVAYEVNGIIYATGKGKATIMFRENNGGYQECVVIVK